MASGYCFEQQNTEHFIITENFIGQHCHRASLIHVHNGRRNIYCSIMTASNWKQILSTGK